MAQTTFKARKLPKNLPEFDVERDKLSRRAQVLRQQQQQGIKRQFARTGMLSSGHAVKTLAKSGEELARQEQEGLAQIGGAEAREKRRLQEVDEQRQFVSGQAQLGREFQAGQAQLGREFQSQEAGKVRSFQAAQAGEERGLRKSFFETEQEFKQRLFDFDKSTKEEQLKMAKDQFDLDKETVVYNKLMAAFSLPDSQQKTIFLANMAFDPNIPQGLRNGLQGFVQSVANTADISHLLPDQYRQAGPPEGFLDEFRNPPPGPAPQKPAVDLSKFNPAGTAGAVGGFGGSGGFSGGGFSGV